ncbi:MAG: gluconate transporter, partial [Verrucomicrobiota bacterium]
IPVFFDVGLVIVASILFSLTKRTGKSLLVFGLPLTAAMATTHAFVPPTPGPAYVAYALGVDLGTMIVVGILVAIPTAIVAALVGQRLGSKLYVPVPTHLDVAEEIDEKDLPSFGLIALIIALPIGLILLGTGIERFVVASGIPEGLQLSEYNAQLAERVRTASLPIQIISFLGKPIIALLVATLAALLFLGRLRGTTSDQLLELSTKALGPAGIIILITGAGGVFKGILIATGIAQALADFFGEMPISLVAVAFILATVIRVAQGSATVAMVTSAALVSTLAEEGTYSSFHMALVVVAIASGSTMMSHVNDSGFWIVNRYFGMSVKDTLKTWSVVTCVIALTGFAFAMLLSLFA